MNGPSVPPRVLLFVVQGSEKPLRRALDVLGGAVDDFGELDGQTVEFRQAARHVVVARFVGDQVVEAAAGKCGNVFRQGLAGLHIVQGAVHVVAELGPVGGAGDEHGVFAAQVLDDKKGFDIVVLDVGSQSMFADYLIIAAGGSERQINALASEVEDRSEKNGRFVKHIEGKNGSGWILMDYGDVIINLMVESMREKYNLEKIWSDCEQIEWEV